MAAEHFTGTAGQQRVPADFLRTASIPVPPMNEQVDAVAAIDRTVEGSLMLAEKRRRVGALAKAMELSALNEVFVALT